MARFESSVSASASKEVSAWRVRCHTLALVATGHPVLSAPTSLPEQALKALRALKRSVDIDGSTAETSLASTARMIRSSLTDADSRVRSTALRTLRYVCAATPAAWLAAWCEYVDLFVVRCLERKGGFDQRILAERIEALKLFRWLVNTRPADITEPLLAAVIAVAECDADHLKYSCIEVLRELAVADVAVLDHRDSRADGLGAHRDLCPLRAPAVNATAARPPLAAAAAAAAATRLAQHTPMSAGSGIIALVSALAPETDDTEPAPPHVAMSIVLTLGHLLDQPHTRGYVRPSDLQRLLSPISELSMQAQPTPPSAERLGHMKLSASCFVALARTWSGLLVRSSCAYAEGIACERRVSP